VLQRRKEWWKTGGCTVESALVPEVFVHPNNVLPSLFLGKDGPVH
jgi:hypothetical protein